MHKSSYKTPSKYTLIETCLHHITIMEQKTNKPDQEQQSILQEPTSTEFCELNLNGIGIRLGSSMIRADELLSLSLEAMQILKDNKETTKLNGYVN
jgi:hypothetical protein